MKKLLAIVSVFILFLCVSCNSNNTGEVKDLTLTDSMTYEELTTEYASLYKLEQSEAEDLLKEELLDANNLHEDTDVKFSTLRIPLEMKDIKFSINLYLDEKWKEERKTEYIYDVDLIYDDQVIDEYFGGNIVLWIRDGNEIEYDIQGDLFNEIDNVTKAFRDDDHVDFSFYVDEEDDEYDENESIESKLYIELHNTVEEKR